MAISPNGRTLWGNFHSSSREDSGIDMSEEALCQIVDCVQVAMRTLVLSREDHVRIAGTISSQGAEMARTLMMN